ncbi:5'-3' exoribonuclease 2 homolog [Schistocerca serialis cubense]|uniref:5'-3' exoribonuclease 2 homolog n=1 Tax=Schistocerca serialis cubense TaxID=2023355 RepID=UPI00214F1C64|nr:5'-3' exoribonuclease 2 homolog [Schistocerca serialis cubense]
MGVPAFFRWLSRKYASVIVTCIEEKAKEIDGLKVEADSSQPNPNGVEFDNLYLDMNGIIHPCTHPEDKPAPKDEDEMMVAIFECIDRLFNIVRPRKLLYMAIDGVAPRAKMNQQRSRRFRASKESVEKVQEMARIRSELAAKGCFLPPEKPKESHFDSNCITPGTPFMARLSTCLHYYIHDRLNNNPGWKGIKVILSDANVPGEGEHKIMDYIRRQRAQPDHDPNTQHVLCGADADLIMLGLATHEPNFTIIREEFKPNKPKPCDICSQMGHEMKDCQGLERELADGEVEPAFSAEVEFIFVRLSILREYLQRELEMPGLPFPYDFERAVDDWVFMCFFVGNDFLPHLPSLEIRENAIDRLVNLYKKAVYKTGGFLTDSGNVNLDRVQLIMSDLGEVEDEIFKSRQEKEVRFKERNKAQRKRQKLLRDFKPAWTPVGQYAPTPVGQPVNPIQNPRQEAYRMRMQAMNASNTGLNALIVPEGANRGVKRKSNEMEDNSDSEEEEVNDEVRLWEDGFKDRYYESKFDVGPDNIEFRVRVAHEYVRGLCWVLRYYYQGCASWKWYFPYHYAPFASDFINIGVLSTEFEKGTKPFRPLEQLMGVFPAASSSHVPAPWAKLMSDPDSNIIDFYPEDFKIDLNGKKFAWQGVALLPFVDETRLFAALEPYYSCLTAEEIKRNVRGDDRLYVTKQNSGFNFIRGLYQEQVDPNVEVSISIDGMRGTVLLTSDCVPQGGSLNSPVVGLSTINNNEVYCVKFRDPKYADTFIFPAKRLKGAREPPRVLKPQDLNAHDSRNWRPQIGMSPATQRASLGAAGHRMLGHYNQNSPQQATGLYNQFVAGGILRLSNTFQNQGSEGGGFGGGRGRRDQPQDRRGFHSTNSSNTSSSGYGSGDSNRYGAVNFDYSSRRGDRGGSGGYGSSSGGYGSSSGGGRTFRDDGSDAGRSFRGGSRDANSFGGRDYRGGDAGYNSQGGGRAHSNSFGSNSSASGGRSYNSSSVSSAGSGGGGGPMRRREAAAVRSYTTGAGGSSSTYRTTGGPASNFGAAGAGGGRRGGGNQGYTSSQRGADRGSRRNFPY